MPRKKKPQKLVNVKEFSDKTNVTKPSNLTVNPIPLNKKKKLLIMLINTEETKQHVTLNLMPLWLDVG
jgi:hypothetical protein